MYSHNNHCTLYNGSLYLKQIHMSKMMRQDLLDLVKIQVKSRRLIYVPAHQVYIKFFLPPPPSISSIAVLADVKFIQEQFTS